MKVALGSFAKVMVAAVFLCAMGTALRAQAVSSTRKLDCVGLRVASQLPARKQVEETAPDVIIETPDDIYLDFELKNSCSQTIFYLAYNLPDLNKAPVGYMIYRAGDGEWKARSPGWRRPGDLSGRGLHWLPIMPGSCFRFEGSDLSLIKGERSLAIYVNTEPRLERNIEMLAVPFTIALNEVPERRP